MVIAVVGWTWTQHNLVCDGNFPLCWGEYSLVSKHANNSNDNDNNA